MQIAARVHLQGLKKKFFQLHALRFAGDLWLFEG
jgi:hypothetical protein